MFDDQEAGFPQGNLSELVKLDYRLLDPEGLFIPLVYGSMIESIKEPAWPEIITDTRSLAVFLQYNMFNSNVEGDKKALIENLKCRLLSRSGKVDWELPIIGVNLQQLFDQDLVPLYNDLILMADKNAYLVSLMELRVRNINVRGDLIAQLERKYSLELRSNFLLAISGNLKRALVFEDIYGYVNMIIDAGRLMEKIKNICMASDIVCKHLRAVSLIGDLNRYLGFSGYYYSVLSLMIGGSSERRSI